jgi:hypothetical protein
MLGANVYHLGGMEEDQDPYDKLRDAVNVISGFSLKHLMAGAKRAQEQMDKPVNIHFTTSGPRDKRDIVFNADEIIDMDRAEMEALEAVETKSSIPEYYYYDADDFLPLLTYDHANKAMLEQTIEQITRLLGEGSTQPKSEKGFHIPSFFIRDNRHSKLEGGLILWLRIVIEQQVRKRKIRETDATLAEWLHTSRATISKYKRRLKEQGYLVMESGKRPAPMSAVFYPRT